MNKRKIIIVALLVVAVVALILSIVTSQSSQSQNISEDQEIVTAETAGTQSAEAKSTNSLEQTIVYGREGNRTDGATITKGRTDKIITDEGEEFPLRIYRPLSLPNDPYAGQWWVNNVGLDKVWEVPEGENDVLLAVVDTGFALEHEEFNGRWFENPGEAGPTDEEAPSMLNCTDQGIPLDMSCNNIDDDGDGIINNESGPTNRENISFLNCSDRGLDLDKSCNLIDDNDSGYIDDVTGWDFINGGPLPQAGKTNPNGSGVHHGSYVLGVAAANRDNGVGLAGVNNSAKILPLQALDDDSYGHTLSVSRAVRYAAEVGADIISLSLGTDATDPYLRAAIHDAMAAGSVVVAASGNDGCNCIAYPANYPEVVAVGASNSSNNPYSFSSYGANLDIIAPGANYTTTDWKPDNQTSAYASGIAGTSLATPLVSGHLATLKSHMPDASATELVSVLTENTRRSGMGDEVRTDKRGFGRLAARKSLNRLLNPYTPDFTYEFRPVSSGQTVGVEETGDGRKVRVYDCNVYGKPGTTPLYVINPADGERYISSSHAERAVEIINGGSASLLARICVLLPHDTPETTRIINTRREFMGVL